MEKRHGTKLRLLKVMLAILEQPYRYTKKQLAAHVGVDASIIKADIETFKNAGFVPEYDTNYRYAFKEEKPLKQLKELLHFSEEDQLLLEYAIDYVGKDQTKRAEQLKKKLSSLYDYRRLGHAYLQKPYMAMVDNLEAARKEKKMVWLKAYHSSNSNQVKDRLVEPFQCNTSEDILHAFDVEKKELRHFRISRIERVELLEEAWLHEGKHNVIATDPFRIADNQQVQVCMRMRVGAYNELIERFPLTKAHISLDAEKDVYYLQCKVNSKFYGLTNFILGHHHQLVEIEQPELLLEHLRKEVKKMQEKWGVD